MAAIIFDNSTLTAVQRLMGSAPAPSSYDAQGDYSALEALLSSLIFYDDYYFVDDYKAEFRDTRDADFRFIHPIPTNSFPYQELENLAVSKTEELVLDIRAGRQAEGLLKDFLEAMNLHLTCAWHMQSSDYFLTLKILADEQDTWENRYKYSPLTAMIFQQLSGAASPIPPTLIGTDGHSIHGEESRGNRSYFISAELRHFSNALNWLARRAAFYSLLSSHFGAALSLHPIRHNFLAKWSIDAPIIDASYTWRRRIADYFGKKSAEAVNAINSSADSLEIGLALPLFGAWAVGTRGNVRDAISFILDTAQEPQAVAIRQYMADIDELRESGQILAHKKAVNDLRAAIEAECAKLTRRYGGQNLATALTVSINAQLLPVPSLSAGIDLATSGLRIKFGQPRHLRTQLRNVVSDVLNFESLGDVRRALLRDVQRSKEHSMPALRIEERRHFGRPSSWKEPM